MKQTLKAILLAAVLALPGAMGVALMHVSASQAQTMTSGLPIVPLGYCQLADVSAATKLSDCAGGIPAGAVSAYVEAEAQIVRYRDDGVAPTASVGMPIASGGSIFYQGTLSKFQAIEATSGAKLNVLFYR